MVNSCCGTAYIVQVGRCETMEKFCCVSSVLRGADDCTVSYTNTNHINFPLLWKCFKKYIKKEISCCTCRNGPHQRHQTHLDRTTPGPHDQHHPQRLTDHQTLIQGGGLFIDMLKISYNLKTTHIIFLVDHISKLCKTQCTIISQKAQGNLGFNLI